MINPLFVEHQTSSHQADLRHEAEMDRLAHEAKGPREGQGAVGDSEGLRSRLGDLLLAYGLRLKRLDAPSALSGGTAAIPSGARLALVAVPPLPTPAPTPASATAQPVSGFSLLRYETLPPVGVFFWRLDRLGFGSGGIGTQSYLTLTWLAVGSR